MHKKLAFILTMFAMVIGSLIQANAAVASEPQGTTRPTGLVLPQASPKPPSNLSATNSAASVILTWVNNGTAGTFWVIQRATNADFTTKTFDVFDFSPAVVTYTDGAVAADTTYYYRVAKGDSHWHLSAWSSTVSVTTPPTAPSGPAGHRQRTPCPAGHRGSS